MKNIFYLFVTIFVSTFVFTGCATTYIPEHSGDYVGYGYYYYSPYYIGSAYYPGYWTRWGVRYYSRPAILENSNFHESQPVRHRIRNAEKGPGGSTGVAKSVESEHYQKSTRNTVRPVKGSTIRSATRAETQAPGGITGHHGSSGSGVRRSGSTARGRR